MAILLCPALTPTTLQTLLTQVEVPKPWGENPVFSVLEKQLWSIILKQIDKHIIYKVDYINNTVHSLRVPFIIINVSSFHQSLVKLTDAYVTNYKFLLYLYAEKNKWLSKGHSSTHENK